ncbi:hypothetical protein MKX01_010513 [Papaver californicum]|nr:hypothetical protein MKX01_010513 [Papaver californicum]
MAEEGPEGDETRNPNWAELTYECLTNILSRLSLEERWIGPMFVCKSWIHACKDPCFFSVVDLESRKIDSLLISVVNWSGGINIQEIRIRHCSDQSLSFVAQRCTNLQVLSIKSCPNVSNASIEKIASHCPVLAELDISYCYEISHASLENVEAAAIGKFMPNLEHLELRFSKLTVHGLTAISKGCVKLVLEKMSFKLN